MRAAAVRTSGGRLGTATLLPLLVAEGVLYHTLTFECVGHCSCKVLNRRQAAVVKAQVGTVSGVATMYACGSCIRAGRSPNTSRY